MVIVSSQAQEGSGPDVIVQDSDKVNSSKSVVRENIPQRKQITVTAQVHADNIVKVSESRDQLNVSVDNTVSEALSKESPIYDNNITPVIPSPSHPELSEFSHSSINLHSGVSEKDGPISDSPPPGFPGSEHCYPSEVRGLIR